MILAIPGTATPQDDWIVRAAVAAWEDVEGRPHEPITANSGATDANILRARGLSTARVGMARAGEGAPLPVDFPMGMNVVDVRELEKLTRTLIHTVVTTCTRTRQELENSRMSTIVAGIGASHSTLMNTHWDEVAEDPGALRFRAGLEAARDVLAEARPDTVIIIGSNHFRGMFLDLMPAFTVGVGEVIGAGEADTPKGRLPADTALARTLVDTLSRTSTPRSRCGMQVDHGITHSYQHLVPGLDVPIVPVVVNMFAPPLPSLRRCDALGAAIGRAVRKDGQDKRVAVIASGGLSHRLPWPKWYRALSDDDRFLVEAWLEGRDSWQEYEVRRRQIIRAAEVGHQPGLRRPLPGRAGEGRPERVPRPVGRRRGSGGGQRGAGDPRLGRHGRRGRPGRGRHARLRRRPAVAHRHGGRLDPAAHLTGKSSELPSLTGTDGQVV